MKPPFGMPGIGGSLGQCALCGDTFLLQILTGEDVVPIEVDGVNNQLYSHKACVKKFQGWDILELPVASPLRQAMERKQLQPTTAP